MAEPERSPQLKESRVSYKNLDGPDVLVRPVHDRVPVPAIKPDKSLKKQKDKSGTTQPPTIDPSDERPKTSGSLKQGFKNLFTGWFRKTSTTEHLIGNAEEMDGAQELSTSAQEALLHKLPDMSSEEFKVISKNQDKWVKKTDVKNLKMCIDEVMSVGTDETTLPHTDIADTGNSTDEDVQTDELEQERLVTNVETSVQKGSKTESECRTMHYEFTCRNVSEEEIKDNDIQKHYMGSRAGPNCSPTKIIPVDCNEILTDVHPKIDFKVDDSSTKDINGGGAEQKNATESKDAKQIDKLKQIASPPKPRGLRRWFNW